MGMMSYFFVTFQNNTHTSESSVLLESDWKGKFSLERELVIQSLFNDPFVTSNYLCYLKTY